MTDRPTGQQPAPATGRKAREIERAASQWLARQALGSLSEEDHRYHEAWLRADPAHAAAFARMSSALASVDGAGTVVREADRRARIPASRRGRRRTGAALGIACVAVISVLSSVDLAAELADVRTGRGELRTIALADGSRLLLDADAAVDVRYDARQRMIRLVRGRVHATVRHGDPRPFLVAALGGEVRDIGTAFDVAMQGKMVETLVTDGVVLARNGDASLRLTKGQGASWRENEAPAAIREPAGAEAASWRYGRLVFDRRPFGEVVAMLDRYSSKPIWLWNGDVAGREVSGVVRSATVDESLASLAGAQGLKVRDLGIAIILY